MKQFPKWKYSLLSAVIVDDAEQEAALVGDWFDFPEHLAAHLDEKARKIDEERRHKLQEKADQEALDREIEALRRDVGKDNSTADETTENTEATEELPDIETLRATAAELGIEVHPRAGAKKISEQIKAAIEAKGE